MASFQQPNKKAAATQKFAPMKKMSGSKKLSGPKKSTAKPAQRIAMKQPISAAQYKSGK